MKATAKETRGASAYMVTMADEDGTDCGSVSWTVSGDIVLTWGYGDQAVSIYLDPPDVDAVVNALLFVRKQP